MKRSQKKNEVHEGGIGNGNINLIPSNTSLNSLLKIVNSNNECFTSFDNKGRLSTNRYLTVGQSITFGRIPNKTSGEIEDPSDRWISYLNNMITSTQFPKRTGVNKSFSTIGELKSIYSYYNETYYTFDNFVPSFKVLQDNYYDRSTIDNKLSSKANSDDVYPKSYIDQLEARIAALENNSKT